MSGKAGGGKGTKGAKGKLWTNLKSPTLLIFGVTLVTFLLHHFGWLEPLESTSLDFSVRLREPVKTQNVWIVSITDDDYENPQLFKKTSPLDPGQLQKVISAIATLEPRVIGIDIDTTDSQGVRPETGVPIVWGQRVTLAEDAHERHTLPVLGNEQPQPIVDELGVFVMPADADGAVRRYRRKIPTAEGHVDSLPWAVTKAFCRNILADATATDDLKLRSRALLDSESTRKYRRPILVTFSDPPHTSKHVLSVSDLLHIASTDGWKTNTTFRNGIVLLGGTFGLSGDVSYVTPLGTRAGVQLFADAIETELQQRPITTLNETLMLILEVIGGYSLALWHFVSKGWRAVTLRVLLVPGLAIVFSLVAFSSLAYWANFIPVLVGVSIHELYEHFQHHRHLLGEVQEMKQKLRRPRRHKTQGRP